MTSVNSQSQPEQVLAQALLAESKSAPLPGPKSRRERLAAIAMSITGFLMFYVLSAGPMSGLVRVFKVSAFEKCFSIIYAPLVFIVKNDLKPVSTILKAYAELFR